MSPASLARVISQEAEVAGSSSPLEMGTDLSRLSRVSGFEAGNPYRDAEQYQFDLLEEYRLGGEWQPAGEGSYQQREVEGYPLTYLLTKRSSD